jgi:hypothetical protein
LACYRQGVRWLVLVAALSTVAHAEPKAQLTYVREPGAEACPDESEVRKAVAQRLGYDPFGERPLSTVAVTVGRSAKGVRARIEITDAAGEPTGSRELTSRQADCMELAWAVELAISLAIDPLHFADAPPPSVAPAQAAPAPATETNVLAPPAPVAAPPAPAIARVLEPKRRYRLGAGAFAVLGSSPTVAFGFRATAGVRARLWSMNLEARADIPAAAPAAGGTVATGVYAGALVPCFHQLMFAGCGLVVLGAHHAIGTGYPNANDPWAFYAALGVRAAIEVKLNNRLELQVAADLLAPLTRIKLQLDGIDTVFETPAVSGAFHFALAGYFR